MKKKVNYEENLKTPQILTKKTYIMGGFLMEKARCPVIVMLTTKDSNFNRGNVNYEGIPNEKSKI